MTTYALNGLGSIVRGDGAIIPFDPGNLDYVAYLAWVALGNTAAAAPTTPSLVASAQTAMAASMPVTSTLTPALNATYACDDGAWLKAAAVVASIANLSGLPGGGSTFNWPDATGTMHAFTSGNFVNFAKVLMSYNYALNQIIATNSGTLPATPVHIA